MPASFNAIRALWAQNPATSIQASRGLDPVLRPPGRDVRRSRSLLASLLGSAALLMGGQTAWADTCVFPLTQAFGTTCTDLVIGTKTADPAEWISGSVSNSGTINNTGNNNTVDIWQAVDNFENKNIITNRRFKFEVQLPVTC